MNPRQRPKVSAEGLARLRGDFTRDLATQRQFAAAVARGDEENFIRAHLGNLEGLKLASGPQNPLEVQAQRQALFAKIRASVDDMLLTATERAHDLVDHLERLPMMFPDAKHQAAIEDEAERQFYALAGINAAMLAVSPLFPNPHLGLEMRHLANYKRFFDDAVIRHAELPGSGFRTEHRQENRPRYRERQVRMMAHDLDTMAQDALLQACGQHLVYCYCQALCYDRGLLSDDAHRERRRREVETFNAVSGAVLENACATLDHVETLARRARLTAESGQPVFEPMNGPIV